jgi:hypothetical protein
LGHGGVAVEEAEGVAAEDTESGDGLFHEEEESGAVGEDAGGFLAEAEEFGAEFVFDAGAVVGVVDDEGGDEVLAMEEAAALLHVVEFDGEAVGGAGDFIAGHQEGRGVAEIAPPGDDLFGFPEFVEADAIEDAEDVEVGDGAVVVAGGGGAIEDDGDEGGAVGVAEFVNELIETFLHGGEPEPITKSRRRRRRRKSRRRSRRSRLRRRPRSRSRRSRRRPGSHRSGRWRCRASWRGGC